MNAKTKATVILLAMYGLGLGTGIAWYRFQKGHDARPSAAIDRRVKHLSRELRLTSEQEEQARLIFKNARDKARQLNEEVSWDIDDIHRDSVDSLQNILTPQQMVRFESIHRRFHQHLGTPRESDNALQVQPVATASAPGAGS
jgi:hypothetical protein